MINKSRALVLFAINTIEKPSATEAEVERAIATAAAEPDVTDSLRVRLGAYAMAVREPDIRENDSAAMLRDLLDTQITRLWG